MVNPFRVGLTGGIASGKSLVAELFLALGPPVIDADQAARAVVEPETPGLAEVVATFGPQALTAAGTLNRPWLRERIFADSTARTRLEAILHPRIREWMDHQLAGVNSPYAILCIPLLVEKRLQATVDRVLVVDLPEALQLERLCRRDGIGAEQARAILAAQCHRDERLAVAHDIIDNSGAPDALPMRVAALHRHYLALAAARKGHCTVTAGGQGEG